VIMQDKAGLHGIITGLVQGVCFRSFTQEEAQKLGLTGWVKNLQNGQVEVKAFGLSQDLSALKSWLQKGPKRAKVEKAEFEACDFETHKTFEIAL